MIYIVILWQNSTLFDRKWLGRQASAGVGTYIYTEKHTDGNFELLTTM